MTYVVDIDGTICTHTGGDYESAKPYNKRIQKINKLYDEGHVIIFLTARGMGRFSNDREKAYTRFLKLTKEQLDTWGVKYHEIFFRKTIWGFLY